MVPGAGLEPACPLQTGDFKSPVYTISPPGHILLPYQSTLTGIEPAYSAQGRAVIRYICLA